MPTNSPRPAHSWRRTIRRILYSIPRSALVVSLVLLLAGYLLLKNFHSEAGPSSKSPSKRTVASSSKLTKGTPTFKTYLPPGKTSKDFGGWTKVSPPGADPVYAFSDKVGVVPIIVSQQRIPSSFSKNIKENIKDLAESYHANDKITLNDMEIYVGSAAGGPRSIIFTKDETLVLIKTDSEISNDSLVRYIKSLQ
ncbi:hypothetical protein KBD87_00435 [Candidatus Saccharibacteria bacterium]|nr:hypothetical protein [Candidatus Saccharibacteria bacterium]